MWYKFIEREEKKDYTESFTVTGTKFSSHEIVWLLNVVWAHYWKTHGTVERWRKGGKCCCENCISIFTHVKPSAIILPCYANKIRRLNANAIVKFYISLKITCHREGEREKERRREQMIILLKKNRNTNTFTNATSDSNANANYLFSMLNNMIIVCRIYIGTSIFDVALLAMANKYQHTSFAPFSATRYMFMCCGACLIFVFTLSWVFLLKSLANYNLLQCFISAVAH